MKLYMQSKIQDFKEKQTAENLIYIKPHQTMSRLEINMQRKHTRHLKLHRKRVVDVVENTPMTQPAQPLERPAIIARNQIISKVCV